ncbi:SIR2 family protein [Actinoplanes sp. CA-051413]|uniref:SIR2 family protein n=1 Tax=Actinoplanes sp. CA-051413 TaxID=3239899 RepID=UPI003D986E0C
MTSAGLYLEVATRVNSDHQARRGSNELAVVPIVVDDLEQAGAVARCLSELIGGGVLHANVLVGAPPRAGNSDSRLRAAVEKNLVLRTPRGDERIEISLLKSGDVSATYPSAGPLSGGATTMLGIAKAVIDAQLVSGEIGVILYDESGMDKVTLRSCWSLFVDDLSGLNLGPLRTLVVFVKAWPSVDPHGQPNRGCSFAIVDGRLQRRKPHDNAAGDAAEFARSKSRARVLFLGAGFSVSSRLPLGDGLRDDAIRRLLGEVDPIMPVSPEDLAVRFRRWLVGHDELDLRLGGLTEEEFGQQLTLEQVLAFERVRDPDMPTLQDFKEGHDRALSTPGKAVTALASMLRSPNNLVLTTVNFDELVETHAPGLVQRFATDSEFDGAADYIRRYLKGEETKVPLLKLHGTISETDSCVATTTQTEQGISDAKKAAIAELRGQGEKKTPWIYVGASMRDVDLTPLFAEPSFGLSVDEHWVAPFMDLNVERFAAHRRQVWAGDRGLQSRLITEIADEFIQLLADRWPL